MVFVIKLSVMVGELRMVFQVKLGLGVGELRIVVVDPVSAFLHIF